MLNFIAIKFYFSKKNASTIHRSSVVIETGDKSIVLAVSRKHGHQRAEIRIEYTVSQNGYYGLSGRCYYLLSIIDYTKFSEVLVVPSVSRVVIYYLHSSGLFSQVFSADWLVEVNQLENDRGRSQYCRQSFTTWY